MAARPHPTHFLGSSLALVQTTFAILSANKPKFQELKDPAVEVVEEDSKLHKPQGA